MKIVYPKLLLITFFICFINKALSQIPSGKFGVDSMKLGQVINYTLVFKHDDKVEVFFPDLNFNYAPFEYVDKIYFPTKTSNGISTDSAIYKIRSFAIDSIQNFALPIFSIFNNDSIAKFPAKDSVYLLPSIYGSPAKLKLKSGSSFLPMKTKPNFLVIFAQLFGVLAMLFILWLIFGKRIRKHFYLLSIYRSHLEFNSTFNRYAQNTNKTNIKKGLILWKKYMSRLKNLPFNTMTTPEILENIPNKELNEALREIDSSIYGNSISAEINDAITTLKNLADNQYNILRKEIRE